MVTPVNHSRNFLYDKLKELITIVDKVRVNTEEIKDLKIVR